jgi:hypothetical protein
MNMKNPYLYNPVAKSLLEQYEQKIFENENVDFLLSKISDNALNIFKVLTFDLAPKRDRNPDVIRVKLSHISDSQSVKSLTAKLLDYADDNDVSNSKFAEVKRLYLESLKKYCEALNRAVEIGKDKEQNIVKIFNMGAMKAQSTIDFIAKEAEAEDKRKKESLNESSAINENIFEGYRGRVNDLRKTLTNLITSAEGKDQKGGYGRNWKQVFIDLDQKRQALDITENGTARKKDKDALEKLEKDVHKFQDEFNTALINASNKSIQQVESDEDVNTKYQDVTELTDQAIIYQTKAKTQYLLAMEEIRDELKAKEDNVSKVLFPLKRGDTDSDPKIKGTGLIFAIQAAMANGITAFGKLIKQKKGPNGKFGPATQSGVMAIQKISGNKNANGEIDKTLLHDMMISDWVSDKDRKAIQKALDTIKDKMNEGFGSGNHVSKMGEFVGALNEDKIVINQSEFEKELNTQYKSVAGDKEKNSHETVDHSHKSAKDVPTLAKKLRTEYGLKVEEDTFLKSDGALKSAYTHEFIKSWNKAIEETSKSDKKTETSYFYTKGGLYNINVASSSLRTPCNAPAWAETRKIKALSGEDTLDFVSNYLKGWRTFGMIRPEWRYDGIKELIGKVEKDDEYSKEHKNAYDAMSSAIKNKSIPFIEYSDLKGPIAMAFKMVSQANEKDPDLSVGDAIAINNFFVTIANAISCTDDGKFISCIKWIHDNALGEKSSKGFKFSSGWLSDIMGKSSGEDLILTFESSRIPVLEASRIKSPNLETLDTERMTKELPAYVQIVRDLQKDDPSSKAIALFGKNLYHILSDIYPGISSHVQRMNAKTFSDVPQKAPFLCVDIDGK